MPAPGARDGQRCLTLKVVQGSERSPSHVLVLVFGGAEEELKFLCSWVAGERADRLKADVIVRVSCGGAQDVSTERFVEVSQGSERSSSHVLVLVFGGAEEELKFLCS